MSEEDDFAPSHWEKPPHDRERYEDYDGSIIVCDVDGCNWVGTSFASQFALHSLRRHEEHINE